MASDPIPGMETVVATVSGYRGSELVDLIELMTHAGANYIGKLSSANAFTHLVCRKFEGKKYEMAKRFRLIIVNHRWIEDCVKHGKRVPEQLYTLQSGEEVGPLCMKAPLVTKPGSSAKKGKAAADEPRVFGNSEDIIDLGCRSSWQGVLTDSRLLNENSFAEFKQNNSSQKRQNNSVKTNSKKELQSSSMDCFEDPPLSRSLRMENSYPEFKENNSSQKRQTKDVKTNSIKELQFRRRNCFEDPPLSRALRMKESCGHSVRAERNIPRDIGMSMAAEIPRKKRRLVKKNIGSARSVLSDSDSDRECHPTGVQSIHDDRVTILSDDSNDDLDTGYKGGEVGGNHLSTSKDPNISVVNRSIAPETTPQNGCLDAEKLEIGSESDQATKGPLQDFSCVICWTEFSTTRGILPCGHRYCYPCIENWADQLSSRRKISTCPLCKAPFTAITKVDDAITSDQNIFSQTIPSAPKVDISFLIDQGTSNFAAQSASVNVCAECHSLEPEELLVSCNVCRIRRIHAYCQDPPSDTWTCIFCKDLRSLYRSSYHRY
ncbi:BRCT domain-containing protein At4g02110 isoform X1 [Argentina anserina]|uniref:BRCT domain-containing protein At4g02110 isoform X1 n=1 Tax=Argentina anserina TaxID=57926 RepID=UPI0021765E94|nr:BRCT domain-containing protein At4g02110 isoform X1 [Potentilla anserina]XP_050382522.1 BRCT domain-containing protein At4g02110 isoform X1 [Potentilla anserina]